MDAAISLNSHLFMQTVIEVVQTCEFIFAQVVAFAHINSFLSLYPIIRKMCTPPIISEKKVLKRFSE